MKILEKLFGRKSGEPPNSLTPEAVAEMRGLTYDSYTGRRVTTLRAMQMTAVFGCIRVLSESVGMLPCSLFERTDAGKFPAVKDRLFKLLAMQPNGYMTPQEFWELVMVSLCLRGNFYAYKVKAFGEVVELLPINPDSVIPQLNERWEPVYKVTFPDGTQDALTQDEIWHVRIFTLDGLKGVNPIAFARHAIALGLATEEHGSRLFGNGAVTSGVLQTDALLSDEAFNRLKAEFQEEHQGLGNSHKPLILEQGLKWNSISLNAEDSQFLETRKFQLEEICRMFRVPQHLVQNTDRATFSNIENLGRGFINYSLIPYLTRIEQRINIGLVPKDNIGKVYAKFNAGALLRGDTTSRFNSYKTAIQNGIYSPNECREFEDMNPREGGDIYLTPMNMTTDPDADKEESKQNDAEKTD